MSANTLPTNGRAKMYDEDGSTIIPKVVREEVEFEAGDVLEFRVEDGYVVVRKIEE